MRRRIAMLVLLSCLSSSSAVFAQEDLIGIYFDNAATINCLTGHLNEPVQAYIILTNTTSTSGVGGWECRLTWDNGMYVTLNSLANGSANVQTFPDFQVGLSQALWSSTGDPLVLATLNVFATEPGALYITAASNASLPGVATPIYAKAVDPSDLVVTVVNGGGGGLPCASLGAETCGGVLDARTLQWPEWTETLTVLDTEHTSTLLAAQSPPALQTLTRDRFIQALYSSDVCCVGRILNTDYRCFNGHPARESAAVVLVEVDREFFGPGRSVLTVYVPCVEAEGCMIYEGGAPRPRLEDLKTGEKVLVTAYMRENFYVANEYGVLVYPEGVARIPNGPELEIAPESVARDFSRSVLLQRQTADSEFIIYGTCLGLRQGTYTVRVDRQIKGASLPEMVEIDGRPPVAEPALCGRLKLAPGSTYVMYLVRDGEFGYRALRQRWSAFHIGEHGTRNDHNALVRIP